MNLFRVASSVAILGSALAFGGSAHAQQLVCQTAPGGAGMLRAGDFTNCRLAVGGQTRTFDIHVPASYTGNTRTFPLVIDMHGFTNTKAQQAAGSGFRPLSDQRDFVYVAAQGIGNAWSAMGSCCRNLSDVARLNDINFLTRIVAEVSRNGRINASQVFATGFSNGGSMANTLACLESDVFAGIATFSFPLSGAGGQAGIVNACTSPRVAPLPVIAFHGTNDNVISFNGGARGGFIRDTLSAANSNRAWAQIQGCTLTPRNTTVNGRACQTFSGCRGGTSVALCTTQGGGHTNRVAGAPQQAWDFWQTNLSQ
jgi:poly(3-hydroxybutyrate) depolymerase